jgi:hypothetical protein
MSTNFTRNNRQYRTKKPQDEKVVIDAEAFERPERPEYLCDYCNFSLSKLGEEGKYWCAHCSITVYPKFEDVRTKSRLATPDGPNQEALISYSPEN